MGRWTSVVACLAAGLGWAIPPLLGDEPAVKPPYRRLLQGEDARQAAALEKRCAEQEANDDYAGAIESAEQNLTLRRRVQGDGHPEVVTLVWDLRTLRKVAALPAEERRTWREATSAYGTLEQLERQGKRAEALAARQRLLDRCRQVHDAPHPDLAIAWNTLAFGLSAQGKPADAEPLFRRALTLARETVGDEHPLTAVCYNNVGYSLGQQGRATEAEPLYLQALQIRQRVFGESHAETAQSYNAVAHNLGEQGRHAAAEPLFRRALELRMRLLGERHPDTARSCNNVAYNLHMQGRDGDAEPLYRQSVALHRQLFGAEHPHTATARANLAGNLEVLGALGEAESLYRDVLEVRRRRLGEAHVETAQSYINLGANLNKQGQLPAAEAAYRKALEISRQLLGEQHPQTITTYNNLGINLQQQGRPADGEPLMRRALAGRQHLLGNEHADTARSHYNLARNLAIQGKHNEALAASVAATDSYEAARLAVAASGLERAMFGRIQSPLPLLIAQLARADRAADAWRRLEQHLGRGLLDDFAGAEDALLSADERRRRAEVNRELQALQPRILTLARRPQLGDAESRQLTELVSTRRRLQAELGQLAAELSRRSVLPLEQLQAALPTDAALVVWVDVTDRTGRIEEHWGGVLRRGRPPVWVRLPGSGPSQAWTAADIALPPSVGKALASGAAGDPGQLTGLLHHLAAQRLAPLLSHCDGVRHLLVCSAGALADLPVEALTDQYRISYVPSGSVYARLVAASSRPSSPQTLLALGDPTFDGRHAPLAGTRREVAALEALFPSATVLLGGEASEQRLRTLAEQRELSRFRYLHFATHGEAEAVRHLQSALLLAQDRPPNAVAEALAGRAPVDGRLTAEEVLRTWKLDADLVTLSACQSGLGQPGGGEGFVGFSQALLLCGARSVVLSLWAVDDRATALLMQRFYQNLLGKREGLKKPLAKAEALGEAKAWLRDLPEKDADVAIARLPKVQRGGERIRKVAAPGAPDKPFAHPYYWSAFILIGDPR